jgi:hypothetical protein
MLLGLRGQQVSDGQAEKRIARLEDELGRVLLFTHSLLKVLVEKEIFTQEEFEDAWDELDMEDGKADGKMTESIEPWQCPKCEAMNSSDRTACMFCEEPL